MVHPNWTLDRYLKGLEVGGNLLVEIESNKLVLRWGKQIINYNKK